MAVATNPTVIIIFTYLFNSAMPCEVYRTLLIGYNQNALPFPAAGGMKSVAFRSGGIIFQGQVGVPQ